jgi:hypothetical protein
MKESDSGPETSYKWNILNTTWNIQQKNFVIKIVPLSQTFWKWLELTCVSRLIGIYDPVFESKPAFSSQHQKTSTPQYRHPTLCFHSVNFTVHSPRRRLRKAPRGKINLTALLLWHFTHPYTAITPPSITFIYWKGYPPIGNRIGLCAVLVEAGSSPEHAQARHWRAGWITG